MSAFGPTLPPLCGRPLCMVPYLVVEDAESESALALVEDDLLDEGGPHRAAVERLQRLGQPLRRGAKQQSRLAGGLG